MHLISVKKRLTNYLILFSQLFLFMKYIYPKITPSSWVTLYLKSSEIYVESVHYFIVGTKVYLDFYYHHISPRTYILRNFYFKPFNRAYYKYIYIYIYIIIIELLFLYIFISYKCILFKLSSQHYVLCLTSSYHPEYRKDKSKHFGRKLLMLRLLSP